VVVPGGPAAKTVWGPRCGCVADDGRGLQAAPAVRLHRLGALAAATRGGAAVLVLDADLCTLEFRKVG